jgi:hypothetical protein
MTTSVDPEPAPITTTPDEVTAAPDNAIAPPPPEGNRGGGGRRTLYIAGVATGGGLIAIGALLWVGAAGVQSDLEDAPNRTSADVDRILDLEAKGDRYALWGNICVIGGVAIAGASGFLWWRASRRERTVARVVPTVLDGGGIGIGIAGGWR